MSAPEATDGKETLMSPNSRRTRRALLALLPLTVAATGIWAVAQSRGTHDAPAAAPVATAEMDPGHDMTGVAAGDGVVHLTPEMIQSLGITVEEATLAPMRKLIRTSGNVAYDETRLTTMAPKFGGFVERLHVNFTGQAVRRGQPLLDIYSPELVAAQEELLAALRLERQFRDVAAPASQDRSAALVEAARRRLLLWDISSAQVQQIERTGTVRRALTLHAPFAGHVVELMVQAGQAVEMGMPLYRLADLSTVWVEADVYEQDIRFMTMGETVDVEIAAFAGEPMTGRISYIYPDVRPDTRTARVRIALANPGGRIKPGMYATVALDAPVSERAVLVPRDAVMHSGTHAMVFVEEAPGVYRAREVRIGTDFGGSTQILSGLLAGERVVKRANFLLDSESRLAESMGAMPGMNH
jgi:membrane fusion protein, copper/silver efflux system